jgi:hypothetical protein
VGSTVIQLVISIFPSFVLSHWRKFVLAVFRTVLRLTILIGVIGACLSVFVTVDGEVGGDLLLSGMV